MDVQENIVCVIFDLDGTLADFPINYSSMRSELKTFFAEFGLESDFKPLLPSIKLLSEKCNSDSLASALAIVNKHELQSVKQAKLHPEVISLYSDLIQTEKKDVVILTRNSHLTVEAFLDFFKLHKPNLIVGREDVPVMKPDSQHMQPVFDKFDAKKEEFLLIGDSFHDEELAKNTGINFLRYPVE